MLRLALLTASVAALLGGLLWFGLRPEVERVEEVLSPAAEGAVPGPEELTPADPSRRSGSVPVSADTTSPPRIPLADGDDEESPTTPADPFSGVVVDGSGSPLAGVEIIHGRPWESADDGWHELYTNDGRARTVTDERGRFYFELGSEYGEALMLRWIELEDYRPASYPVDIQRGRPAVLRMSRMSSAQWVDLEVRATDATTGLPVPHFEVEFLPEIDGQVFDDFCIAYPVLDGVDETRISYPPGCTSIQIVGSALGMVDRDLEDPRGTNRVSVVPEPGEAYRVELVLIRDRPEREARTVVTGTVSSLVTGEALPDAGVLHQGRTILTDHAGRFRIATDGGGLLRAVASEHDQVGVDVLPGEVLEIQLPGLAAIHGRVVDDFGQGIGDVEVRFYTFDQRSPYLYSGGATTDQDGRYRVELRSGTYLLGWDPDLPGEGKRAEIVGLSTGEQRELILVREPRPSASLEGTVKAEGVDDLCPAFVQIEGGFSMWAGVRENGGRYVTDPMPFGHYAVFLVHDHYHGPGRGILLPTIEVSLAGRQRVDFHPEIGSIRGRVEGSFEDAFVVFVPRGAGGQRVEFLLGQPWYPSPISAAVTVDGSFALSAVLLREGELLLYDGQGLRARRALDPRLDSDVGTWTVP